MSPLLGKERHEMSLWLKVSLHRLKWKHKRQILTYEITQEWSLLSDEDLEKVSQSGWLGTPTNLLLSMLVELEMKQIVDQGGSWIKIMLKLFQVSNITLVIRLFFWTFWEKILILLIIILEYHLQLSKSMFSNSHRISDTSSHAISY